MTSDKLSVGLITYHAAYNFGSVLQAYATRKALEKLGCSVEIIDYRTQSQTMWYTKDVSARLYGRRMAIKDMRFYLHCFARKRRRSRFEQFINKYLTPMTPRFVRYEDICAANLTYDVLMSGSDQVWNRRCGEFRFEPVEAIAPYFLEFGNAQKRVAYASSFGSPLNAAVEKDYSRTAHYDCLSTREPSACMALKEALGRDVRLVCDPTWLLAPDEWNFDELYTPKYSCGYILVYNLRWDNKEIKRWLAPIKKFAKIHNWHIVLVSPLHYFNDSSIEVLHDAGPIDFLSYLRNASFVVTTTFHGTIFSMNFERPFISCDVSTDSRQGQMLNMCSMNDMAVNSPEDFVEKALLSLDRDFTTCREAIDNIRTLSFDYLKDALKL